MEEKGVLQIQKKSRRRQEWFLQKSYYNLTVQHLTDEEYLRRKKKIKLHPEGQKRNKKKAKCAEKYTKKLALELHDSIVRVVEDNKRVLNIR